jgi:hypothetical protein
VSSRARFQPVCVVAELSVDDVGQPSFEATQPDRRSIGSSPFHGTATITMPLLRAAFAAADDELRTDVAVVGAADLHRRHARRGRLRDWNRRRAFNGAGVVTEASPATDSRIGPFALPTGVTAADNFSC